MTKMIEALEREVQLLARRYHLGIDSTSNLLRDYAARPLPSALLGHNLANLATELSEIAAKYDQTFMLLTFAKLQAAEDGKAAAS